MLIATAVLASGLALTAWAVKPDKPPGQEDKPPRGGKEPMTNPALVCPTRHMRDLRLITVDGSQKALLTNPKSRAADKTPAWSPDGSKIAFWQAPDRGLIWVDLYTIRPDGSELTYIRSFDDWDGPVPYDWFGKIAWSPDGSKVVFGGGQNAYDANYGYTFWVLDVATGVLEPLTQGSLVIRDGRPLSVKAPSFSPDLDPYIEGYQGKLAFVAGHNDIWLLDISIDANGDLIPGTPMNLTNQSVWRAQPAWSPNGEFIVSTRDVTDIWVIRADGTTEEKLLVETGSNTVATWSPDGEWIAFSTRCEGTNDWDIFRIRPDGSDLTNITNTKRLDEGYPVDWNPAWTPDL